MLKELTKDKLSDILAIAKIMDILNKSRYEVTKNENNLYLSNKQYLYGVTETKSKYQYYSNDGTVYGFIVPYDCDMKESDFIECVRSL